MMLYKKGIIFLQVLFILKQKQKNYMLRICPSHVCIPEFIVYFRQVDGIVYHGDESYTLINTKH